MDRRNDIYKDRAMEQTKDGWKEMDRGKEIATV